MEYGVTFVRRKARELWEWTSWKSRTAYFASRSYIVRRGREFKPSTCSVLSTFAAEAAVLILVFPPLEFFLARRGISDNPQFANGVQPIGIGSVAKWSGILCMFLLIASIWLKEIARRTSADDKED